MPCVLKELTVALKEIDVTFVKAENIVLQEVYLVTRVKMVMSLPKGTIIL